MSVLPNQTNLNPTTSFFAAAGSGGTINPGSNLSTLNLYANTLTVSSITNTFSYLGASNAFYKPIFFDQLGPVGSQLPQLGIQIRQRAQDAGAIQSVSLGTDFKA